MWRMRNEVTKIGTCSSAVPAMTGPNGELDHAFQTGNYRERSMQLVQAAGVWNAGTVEVRASLDGGVTFVAVATASAPGFVTLPQFVLGLLKLVGVGLPAGVSVDGWFGGLDARTE